MPRAMPSHAPARVHPERRAVHVVLDYDLQAKHGVIEQHDQQQDEQGSIERTRDEGLCGRVIGSGQHEHRVAHPAEQEDQEHSRCALGDPVADA